jgi:hypothetical protein
VDVDSTPASSGLNQAVLPKSGGTKALCDWFTTNRELKRGPTFGGSGDEQGGARWVPPWVEQCSEREVRSGHAADACPTAGQRQAKGLTKLCRLSDDREQISFSVGDQTFVNPVPKQGIRRA